MILEVSKVLPKHQITLPKEVREKLNVDVDERVIFIEFSQGFVLKKLTEEIVQLIIN